MGFYHNRDPETTLACHYQSYGEYLREGEAEREWHAFLAECAQRNWQDLIAWENSRMKSVSTLFIASFKGQFDHLTPFCFRMGKTQRGREPGRDQLLQPQGEREDYHGPRKEGTFADRTRVVWGE